MSREWPRDEKAIIIDTEQYAGNFEREMVAFITAQTGDCGVGKESQALAEEELPEEALEWFESNVMMMADEHGCFRPASIAPTPGWYNDGHGKHYPDSEKAADLWEGKKHPAYQSVEFVVAEWPPENVMNIISSRAKVFCQRFHKEREVLSRMSCLKGNSKKEIPLLGIRWAERTLTEKQIKQF
jgi:hypothetical protein